MYDKQEVALDKKNIRAACQKDRLEFKFFTSPVYKTGTCMYKKIVTEASAWSKAWISSWPIIKFSLKFSANYKQIKRRISVCQQSLEPLFHALLQFFTLFNCHGLILNTL